MRAGNLAESSSKSSPFQLTRGSPVQIRRCPATVTSLYRTSRLGVERKSDRLPAGYLHFNRRGLRSEPAQRALRPDLTYLLGHHATLKTLRRSDDWS